MDHGWRQTEQTETVGDVSPRPFVGWVVPGGGDRFILTGCGAFVWKWLISSTEIEISGSGGTRRVRMIAEFVDTNWAGGRSNDFTDSIPDFIFVAQDARTWEASSSVIVRDGDFPDDSETSDHRPVEAVLEL